MPQDTLSVAIHDHGELLALRRRLAAELTRRGASKRDVHDLTLAVHEATKNALSFTEGRPVEVTAHFLLGWVIVFVADAGVGIDLSDRYLEEFPQPQAASGRGLPLIHQLVDEVQISSAPGGTIVRMRKRLQALA
jgi:serine/threonine-protein kinase RsbW